MTNSDIQNIQSCTERKYNSQQNTSPTIDKEIYSIILKSN